MNSTFFEPRTMIVDPGLSATGVAIRLPRTDNWRFATLRTDADRSDQARLATLYDGLRDLAIETDPEQYLCEQITYIGKRNSEALIRLSVLTGIVLSLAKQVNRPFSFVDHLRLEKWQQELKAKSLAPRSAKESEHVRAAVVLYDHWRTEQQLEQQAQLFTEK